MDDYRRTNEDNSTTGYEPNFILKDMTENESSADAAGIETDTASACVGNASGHCRTDQAADSSMYSSSSEDPEAAYRCLL